MVKICVHLVIYGSYRKIQTRVPLFWTTRYIEQMLSFINTSAVVLVGCAHSVEETSVSDRENLQRIFRIKPAWWYTLGWKG